MTLSKNVSNCKQVHLPHAIFERVQKFTVCLHSFAQCTSRCMRGSSLRLCFMQKGSFHLSHQISRHDTRNTQHIFLIFFFCSCAMSHAMTHGTRSTSSSFFSSVPGPLPPRRLITSLSPCADPQHLQEGGSYPEQPPPTGYEPNRIVDNPIVDDQENVQANTSLSLITKKLDDKFFSRSRRFRET